MTTVYEEFQVQRRKLLQNGRTASCIVFSREGYMRAMKENIDSLMFVPAMSAKGRATYAGLPYSILPDGGADITVLAELPSPEARRAIRFAMSGPFGKPGEEDPKTMIEIVAQSLSAAQICDICRAWLDSDDETHWGKFERGLDRLIVTHGRFE